MTPGRGSSSYLGVLSLSGKLYGRKEDHPARGAARRSPRGPRSRAPGTAPPSGPSHQGPRQMLPLRRGCHKRPRHRGLRKSPDVPRKAGFPGTRRPVPRARAPGLPPRVLAGRESSRAQRPPRPEVEAHPAARAGLGWSRTRRNERPSSLGGREGRAEATRNLPSPDRGWRGRMGAPHTPRAGEGFWPPAAGTQGV